MVPKKAPKGPARESALDRPRRQADRIAWRFYLRCPDAASELKRTSLGWDVVDLNRPKGLLAQNCQVLRCRQLVFRAAHSQSGKCKRSCLAQRPPHLLRRCETTEFSRHPFERSAEKDKESPVDS